LLTSHFHPPGPTGTDDAHPTQTAAYLTFRRFVRRCNTQDGRLGARLYIYLAGHGFSDPEDTESTAVYTAEADPLAGAPYVPGTEYAEWFRRNAAADEIVLIMDCCRPASPLEAIVGAALPRSTNPGPAGNVRTFYAYATTWGRVARETKIDGEVRGIFTTTVLKALRYATPTADGRVTGSIVQRFVHNEIQDVAGEIQVEPPVPGPGRNGDFTLVHRAVAPGAKLTVRLEPFAGGEMVVVYSGIDREAGRKDATAAGVDFPLQPGFYKVAVEGTGRSDVLEIGADDVTITL
jgi:hypothetical protein